MASNPNQSQDSLVEKYLTFKLSNETYGLEILKVQEIIGMMKVTGVPRTPEYIRGVINLRGKVIPVVDLRIKFHMDAGEDTEKTCIIVVQVQSESGMVTMGGIVDEVSEVLNIGFDQIEPTPPLGAGIDTEFILGMGKVEQKVVMILDVDKVLTSGELDEVEKVTET